MNLADLLLRSPDARARAYGWKLAQLQVAAADPAHPNHEASVWVLRRHRELELRGAAGEKALSQAVTEYRALRQETPA